MIIDGRALAQDLLNAVQTATTKLNATPKLGVVTCVPSPETKQYLELKQKKAKEAGINLSVLELPEYVTTDDCVATVQRLAEEVDGVLIQLPLPKHIDRETVLNAVPVDKDPDGFSYGTSEMSVLPPVVQAIDIIAGKYAFDWQDKQVVILGYGRLVGQPVAHYIRKQGIEPTILTEDSEYYFEAIRNADVLISGVGKPHFITRDMVKDSVAVFDAGASEDGGVIVGDVHQNVAEIASLFTPVPGGIGPITVAALLNNVLKLVNKD